MKMKINLKISKIKSNALKLRASHQLPYVLTFEIMKINKDSDDKFVRYLLVQSEHMLRVKGYYKKYPLAEKECEKIIKADLEKLGYKFD